jgi:hypothetical protein
MKTKKYILAVLLFGGMLFTADATNIINLETQTTKGVDLKKVKVPENG